jgi:hypothetical protein
MASPHWVPFAGGLVIAAAAAAAYANTFSVPLLYDDGVSIAGNPSIRHFGTAFFPPGNATVSGRPILNLTLAANYALGGTALGGLHAANLAIHILAGLTLLGILRRGGGGGGGGGEGEPPPSRGSCGAASPHGATQRDTPSPSAGR